MEEFNEGVERVTAGLEKKQRIIHDDEKQRVAYHESAHALVAYSLPNTDPVHKVSIIPRGLAALGYTMQRPEGDRYLMTQSELESRIQVLLAGTVAEEIDLRRRFDRGPERPGTGHRDRPQHGHGLRHEPAGPGELPREPPLGISRRRTRTFPANARHSEQTAREIDEEIARIIDRIAGEGAGTSSETRRQALVALAERLIEKEVIDNEELKQLIDANLSGARIAAGTADKSAARRAAEDAPASTETKTAEGG